MYQYRLCTLADESLDEKQEYESMTIEKEVDISKVKRNGDFQEKLSACFYKAEKGKRKSQNNKENIPKQFTIRKQKKKSVQGIFCPTANQSPLMEHKLKFNNQSVPEHKNEYKVNNQYKGRRLNFESPAVRSKGAKVATLSPYVQQIQHFSLKNGRKSVLSVKCLK